MFPVIAQMVNHELELKVNLVLSVSLPWAVWADDEEENGKGEMMATITEISSCFPPLNTLPACFARKANGISFASILVSGSNSVSWVESPLLLVELGGMGGEEKKEDGAIEED